MDRIVNIDEYRSILSVQVSYFTNVRDLNPRDIELMQWLKETISPSESFAVAKRLCLEYRLTPDFNLKRKIKQRLPAVTIGAALNTRQSNFSNSEKVRHLSQFTQFDIDAKQNPTIKNFEWLRDELAKIPYVAFTALSVSGQGVWGIVRLSQPEKMAEHFKQLVIDFQNCGIFLDTSKGQNPTQLRFYSYDPNAYLAKAYEPYDRMVELKPLKSSIQKRSSKDVFNEALQYAQRLTGDFQEGNKHQFIYNLCMFFIRKGVVRSQAESYIEKKLIPIGEISSNCIEYPYSKHIHEFGIWL